jgi:hypothetical protein
LGIGVVECADDGAIDGKDDCFWSPVEFVRMEATLWVGDIVPGGSVVIARISLAKVIGLDLFVVATDEFLFC